jgi:hypothetical protein
VTKSLVGNLLTISLTCLALDTERAALIVRSKGNTAHLKLTGGGLITC